MIGASLAELETAPITDERWGPRSLTWLGLAIDTVAVRAMRFVVDRAVMPAPEDLPRMQASAAPYVTDALLHDPARFFAFDDRPPVLPEVTTRPRRRLHDGWVLSHRATVALPRFAGGAGPSDTIRFEHWAHERTRPRGVVVALHGFAMGYPGFDAIALFAPTWFSLGLDVALLTLPQHGPRTPADARFSGERFASPDPAEINETVRRAVWDVLGVARWLREQTAAPTGLLGLSLGGYLAALVAGLTDEIAFAIPMVPPVCMGDLAWRFFEQSRRHRGGTPLALSRDDLRRAFRVHSPLAHGLKPSRDRVLIVAGRGDCIVPPEHPQTLWRHWGEPAIHWFSGGHLAPFGRRSVADAIREHLGRLL